MCLPFLLAQCIEKWQQIPLQVVFCHCCPQIIPPKSLNGTVHTSYLICCIVLLSCLSHITCKYMALGYDQLWGFGLCWCSDSIKVQLQSQTAVKFICARRYMGNDCFRWRYCTLLMYSWTVMGTMGRGDKSGLGVHQGVYIALGMVYVSR